MGEAFAWGLVGQSTLLIGALIALWRPLSRRTLGLVMAFGSGVLLSAVSFELIERAIDTNQGLRGTTLGFFSGAVVFSVANRLLTRPSKQPTERDITTSTSGLTIVLGALLDGIPESAVLGLTLLQDGRISAAMLVAVVISNLPEGIAATVGLRSSGWPTVKVILLWTARHRRVRALSGRRLRRARRGVAVHARLRACVRRWRDPVHALHVDDARGVRTRRPGRGHGHGVRIRCRPHGQLAAGMSSTKADR